MRARNFRYLIVILTGYVLSGCDTSADLELSRYINEVKSRKAQPIEPIPTIKPLAKFVYPENESRRSPFKPKTVKQFQDKLAPNTKRPKQPLEEYPLDSLKFVGILKQDNMIWGLISKPSGEIVRVRPGDYMGQNYGKIIQITNNILKLEETIQIDGKWEKKVTSFSLSAKEQ
ncbi:type IV pilus biogenesis protein PilP [Legionella quinlivanii]|uniref:Type IV pilus biogenesis protein PilP n=1 Tax=Legionella quinlivanii TaxID=45073 RepID=A0A0W0Y1S5_9GAMM|nr:pilus assembly protein PilP [Legionella quinlivanii]KTD50639.1 type IV pilus biogenesis protein PilP [Legionella quinlivanii]SEG35240.1 type IV pilus assembly protein PilP [Legionella quinlivanii DSM 21216]STY11580.1 type IV pilus biogenesis protein PilP [Legionella quinlivanii]